jgi:hypothetical protein
MRTHLTISPRFNARYHRITEELAGQARELLPPSSTHGTLRRYIPWVLDGQTETSPLKENAWASWFFKK